MAKTQKPAVDGSIGIRTMSDVKDRMQTMARDSGLTKKASVAGFLAWRAGERMSEARSAKN
jgi:tetrahydromethanopterin S-methyltransferase subunit F